MTHNSRHSKTVSFPPDIPAKLGKPVALLCSKEGETVDGVEHGREALVIHPRPDESETADEQTP